MGNAGIKIGESFGKLGQVIENRSGVINGYTSHALQRMQDRNIPFSALRDTVSRPAVTLSQEGGNIMYLSKQAAVILNKASEVVTTYSQNEFKAPVLNILNKIK